MRNTFRAYERLKREQHIDTLFRTGKAFSVFPLRVLYLSVPRAQGETAPVRAGFSVPKKKFRKANQRNRLKRLLREAWRLGKHQLYPSVSPDRQLHVFLIFTGTEIPEFTVISEAVQKTIEKLSKLT